ncbi:MAG: Crp/Fnr family transcriptional regulator [Firmicutes bacterium]|nr:Crp/Fnr family transcriptional regulator [Bacillota bacterium]
MEKISGLLSKTKIFKNTPIDIIQDYIIPKGTLAEYSKGRCLFSAQERVDMIKIVISGKVNTVYYYADGSYSLASTVLPLRILALDLIATRTRISPYYAIAAETSMIFSFPADIVLKPSDIPENFRQPLLNQLLIMLSHFHLQKEKHLMVLSRNGLRERIMTYLSLQAQQKKSFSFLIPFSREEMAAYLCVNRSALSHELSLMRKEGWIDFSKNRFTLLKYEEEEVIRNHSRDNLNL